MVSVNTIIESAFANHVSNSSSSRGVKPLVRGCHYKTACDDKYQKSFRCRYLQKISPKTHGHARHIVSLCVTNLLEHVTYIYSYMIWQGRVTLKGAYPPRTEEKMCRKNTCCNSMGSFLQCHGFIVFLGHRCCALTMLLQKKRSK